MYIKHYQLKQDLFPVHPDNHIFFPGGGRELVLQHVLEDLSGGMTLIHLSGEKGSGKTILCQLICEKLRGSQTVLLLSPPSGTFDDEEYSFSLAFGDNDTKQLEEAELYEKILHLISESEDNSDSTLLIIDDAEKLSPTVLMRILHLTDDVHLPQRRLQFVLAGRLPLGTNPEQFAAILAEPLQQFTYTLQPLDREDTARYLAFRLTVAGIPDDNQDNVFSGEAIARIHEATCGNINLINILAEDALSNSCRGKSRQVLLDHVKPQSDFSTALPMSMNRPQKPQKTDRKIVIGIIALILIVSSWAYNVVLVDNRLKHPIDGPLATIQEIPSSLTRKLAPSPPAQTVSPPQPRVASVEGNKTQKLMEKYPQAKIIKSEKTKMVQVTADKSPWVLSKVQTNFNLAGRSTDLDLYQKRTVAGDPWFKGEKNGFYTLQLMALKTRDAETNLKKMFKLKRYREQSGNFYIFKKMSVPETLYVFYGEYKDMATARLTQKSLPDFLRVNQPFGISIKKAMAKLRK